MMRDSASHETSGATSPDIRDVLGGSDVEFEIGELLSIPPVLYEILASRRRRLVLEYLAEYEDPATVTAVATYVTSVEHETLPAAIMPGQRNEILTRLIRLELPKLDNFGLIEWDRDDGDVALNGENGFVAGTADA